MFTWICPKCGGEVPPSQDECQRCKAAEQAAAQPAAPAQQQPPAMPAAQAPAEPSVYPQMPPQPQFPAPPQHHFEHPAPRSHGLRDLLVTLGVAVVLLGGGYFVWQRMEKGDAPEAEKKTELESVKGAKSTHPLAKQIEVTGVRMRLPKKGEADIQLVVVNHSAAEIDGLSIDVVMGAKGTDKELAVFNVKVKRLGPFGSTEVSAKAKTDVSAIDLPDWQFLEPKVVIQSTE
jgi:hypothetical protein